MAVLISLRWPSSSRQTTPISSVTLACRTLVTTLNLCPSCQTTGVLISRGGYINHKRVVCGGGPAEEVGPGFFARVGPGRGGVWVGACRGPLCRPQTRG